MSDRNQDVLSRIGTAFEAGDADAMAELVDPEFELHDHAVLERYVRHGPSAIFANVAAIRDAIPDVRYTPREVLVVDDRRLAVRITGKGRGRWSSLTMERDLGHVWTFEDGRATRLDIHPSWEQALHAVGRAG